MPKRDNFFAAFRIAFGFVWLVNATFKWRPSFFASVVPSLVEASRSEPGLFAGWINLWANIVALHPVVFASLIAAAESAIAISLILGLLTRWVSYGGIALSALIWSTAEGFGGPYGTDSTDIGTAIVYIFPFAAILAVEAWNTWGLDPMLRRKYPEHFLWKEHDRAPLDLKKLARRIGLAIIVVVAASVFAANLPSPESDAVAPPMGAGTIPKSSAIKTFALSATSAIPSIDFDVRNSAEGGWDLHIITANFMFKPEAAGTLPHANEGYALIYVDGAPMIAYSSWYHLAALSKGDHTVTVALVAANGALFTVNGEYIKADKTITE